jgi:uncharacterized protein (TIGR02677 family)
MPRRGELFRHVSAEKAALYRSIMDVFAAAKRQFRLHLRPDEVRAEGRWPGDEVPSPEAVQQALAQLVEWGNLEAQPDTARVQSIEDFYRARFLYRLSAGGEAVESALETFELALARRGELQSVALEDILARLQGLARDRPLDAGKRRPPRSRPRSGRRRVVAASSSAPRVASTRSSPRRRSMRRGRG